MPLCCFILCIGSLLSRFFPPDRSSEPGRRGRPIVLVGFSLTARLDSVARMIYLSGKVALADLDECDVLNTPPRPGPKGGRRITEFLRPRVPARLGFQTRDNDGLPVPHSSLKELQKGRTGNTLKLCPETRPSNVAIGPAPPESRVEAGNIRNRILSRKANALFEPADKS